MPEVVIHDDEGFEKPSEKRKRKLSAAVRKTRQGPRVTRA